MNMIEGIIGILILSAAIKLLQKLSESSEPSINAPEPLVKVPIKREVAVWINGRIESWVEEY